MKSVHLILRAQEHTKFGLPLFYTPCIINLTLFSAFECHHKTLAPVSLRSNGDILMRLD